MRLLSLLFVGFQVMDVATTHIAVGRMGMTEGNPLMAHLGVFGWGLVLKLLACVYILVITNWPANRFGLWALRLITIGTAAVVVRNAVLICL